MKLSIKILIAFFFCCLNCISLFAEEKIETTLNNGMKVLIKPMRAAPVVTVNYWVRSGAVYETEGESGFSELISRLIFENSLNYPDYTLKKEISHAGLRFGKSSSNDCQSYFFTGASKDFEKILALSVDGLYNSVFSEDDVKNAIHSLKMEIAQLESRPDILVFNTMIQEAFKVHPCRRPFYGLNPNYEEANPFLLERYYKKTFTPSNTTLIITGDVEPGKALAEIRRIIEPAKGFDYSEPELPKEPQQEEYREITRYAELEKVYLSFGWKVPEYNNSDKYALYVLAKILGGSFESILWKKLVKGRQTGDFVTASYEASRFESIFAIGAISSKSKYKYFIEDVRRVINGLLDEPLSESVLEEAKRSIISDDVFNCEGVEACALNYGSFAMISDVDDADRFTAGIQSVNLDDIRRVVTEFLREELLTVAILKSRPIDDDSDPVMLTLDNGIKLILKENHASPVISVSCNYVAGGLREDIKNAGISALTCESLIRSYDKDSKSFRSKFEKLGARLSYDINKNCVSVNLKTVATGFIPAFDLFVKMLDKPEFPSNLSKVKKVVEEKLELENNNELLQNEYTILKTAFNNSPITYSDYGRLEELSKIKSGDVADYYKNYFVPSNMVIAIVGDFYPDELRNYILASLGKLNGKDIKVKELKAGSFEGIKSDSPVCIKTKGDEAQIIYLSRAVTAGDKKYLALKLGCMLLEDSLKESFKKADSTGLMASSLQVDCKAFITAGYFMTSVKTNKENVATATKLLLYEIEAFKIGNIIPDKLRAVKQTVFTQRAVGLTDNISLARLYSKDEVLGVGFDYCKRFETDLESVGANDIASVSKEYMIPKNNYIIGVASENSADFVLEGRMLAFKAPKKEVEKKDSSKQNTKANSKTNSKSESKPQGSKKGSNKK